MTQFRGPLLGAAIGIAAPLATSPDKFPGIFPDLQLQLVAHPFYGIIEHPPSG